MEMETYDKLISLTPKKREELLEAQYLLPFASKSSYASRKSTGDETHAFPNVEGKTLTKYQKDITRIINSLAYKKLERKSQIFIAPHGDYYLTRNIHSLKVANISTCIARQLRLNEDLSTAIALAHDTGHTPFGHNGEEKLNEIMGVFAGGFRHDIQGKRVVDKLNREVIRLEEGTRKRSVYGLNLTEDVIDGIVSHTKYYQKNRLVLNKFPTTLEGQIVRIADDIAYTLNDINDACFAGILEERDHPTFIRNLGENYYVRVNSMIKDCVDNSKKRIRKLINLCKKESVHRRGTCKNCKLFHNFCKENNPVIDVSAGKNKIMEKIWEYIEENIHNNEEIKRRNIEAQNIIAKLFNYYWEDPNRLPLRTIDKYKERKISPCFLEEGTFRQFFKFMSVLINKVTHEQFFKIINETFSSDKEMKNMITNSGNIDCLNKRLDNLKYQSDASYSDKLFKLEFFLKYPNRLPNHTTDYLKKKSRTLHFINVTSRKPFQVEWHPQFFAFNEYLRYKRLICDFVAGMTDRYAIWAYKEFLGPEWSSWLSK